MTRALMRRSQLPPGNRRGMVTRANPLHSKYINKAIKGLLANVSPDGRVLNVSGGTAVMNDADGYRNISRDWIQGWGQGLALAFFDKVLVSDELGKRRRTINRIARLLNRRRRWKREVLHCRARQGMKS